MSKHLSAVGTASRTALSAEFLAARAQWQLSANALRVLQTEQAERMADLAALKMRTAYAQAFSLRSARPESRVSA